MDKLSELSKPVAWTDERGNLCTNRNKERGLESRYHQDYEKYTTPFYSQEYVSALKQKIAELEQANREAQPVGFRYRNKDTVSWLYNDWRWPDSVEAEQCQIEWLYTAPPAPANAQAVAWEMRYWNNGYNMWGEWERITAEQHAEMSVKFATDNDYEFRVLYTAPPAPAYPERLPCPVHLLPGLKFGKGVPTRSMLDALKRREEYEAELDAMTPEQKSENDERLEKLKALIPLPEPAAEGELLDAMEEVIRISDRDHEAWDKAKAAISACRAAMLAQPVSGGYKLPDNVREALTLALHAMEFMGDTLNNIDAVCTEDVEYVTPAFNAVRELLAAAPEGGK